jgi:peptidoglycan-associated lipoprotein
LAIALAAMLTLGACKKKVAPAPAPPPPPPAAPTASLTASPAAIQAGQSTTLSWQTTNATEIMIEGLGAVSAEGSRTVTPQASTTYRLVAKGPGGTQDATARVTVTMPPPPPPPVAGPSEAEMFAKYVKDIYFDYDKYDLRDDQSATAKADAQWLVAHPNVRFTIEGHCDERGSTEYNIALGDNRAASVKKALVEAGIAADRIKTVSYGKERPFCTESNEACWQQNRRAHFVYGQ